MWHGFFVHVNLDSAEKISAEPLKATQPEHAVGPEAAPPRIIERKASWVPRFGRAAWQYRDLLRSFVRRDLVVRYKQTALGPTWVIVQPLLGAGVFTFVFATVADVPVPGDVPYFVFALTGLALWTGFSQALTRSTASILGNVDLVTKVYFPRILLPLSAGTSATVDCVVMLVLAVLVLAAAAGATVAAVVTLPILLACVALGTCAGCALGALLVRFRDVQYGVPVLVQSLLFLTPVLYPLNSIPDGVRTAVSLNPLTFYFEALRWGLLDGARPSLGSAAYALTATAIICTACLCVFARLERDFADVI